MPVREIIEIDEEKCTGCGECVPACAEGAIEIIDGKAKVVRDMYCDGLGACLGHCPEDALRIVEREAEPFDEEAAMEYVRKKREGSATGEPERPAPAGGCPGAALSNLGGGCPGASLAAFEAKHDRGASEPDSDSALSHWPVKIRLMPPDAPALDGADLVVAADCAAVAHPDFHKTFVPGSVVLIGCPKFDGVDYEGRFAELFAGSKVNSVTVARMEVPCCGGLPQAVRRGLAVAGADMPYREVVVGRRGETSEARNGPAERLLREGGEKKSSSRP
jgi:Pyruvate/2-oxoacid:ferredoxin oxidoreductase delta subunit